MSYLSMTVAQLRAELEERGLETQGLKKELIARLEENDLQHEEELLKEEDGDAAEEEEADIVEKDADDLAQEVEETMETESKEVEEENPAANDAEDAEADQENPAEVEDEDGNEVEEDPGEQAADAEAEVEEEEEEEQEEDVVEDEAMEEQIEEEAVNAEEQTEEGIGDVEELDQEEQDEQEEPGADNEEQEEEEIEVIEELGQETEEENDANDTEVQDAEQEADVEMQEKDDEKTDDQPEQTEADDKKDEEEKPEKEAEADDDLIVIEDNDIMIIDKKGDVDSEPDDDDGVSWKRKKTEKPKPKPKEDEPPKTEEPVEKDGFIDAVIPPDPRTVTDDITQCENQLIANIYPLSLTDLSHPAILDEIDICSQFNVSFFKTKDGDWKGVIKMIFEKPRDCQRVLETMDIRDELKVKGFVSVKQRNDILDELKGEKQPTTVEKKTAIAEKAKRSLYCWPLPLDVKYAEVEKLFPEAKEILIPQKFHNNKHGFAYIIYETEEAARKAAIKYIDIQPLLKLRGEPCTAVTCNQDRMEPLNMVLRTDRRNFHLKHFEKIRDDLQNTEITKEKDVANQKRMCRNHFKLLIFDEDARRSLGLRVFEPRMSSLVPDLSKEVFAPIKVEKGKKSKMTTKEYKIHVAQSLKKEQIAEEAQKEKAAAAKLASKKAAISKKTEVKSSTSVTKKKEPVKVKPQASKLATSSKPASARKHSPVRETKTNRESSATRDRGRSGYDNKERPSEKKTRGGNRVSKFNTSPNPGKGILGRAPAITVTIKNQTKRQQIQTRQNHRLTGQAKQVQKQLQMQVAQLQMQHSVRQQQEELQRQRQEIEKQQQQQRQQQLLQRQQKLMQERMKKQQEEQRKQELLRQRKELAAKRSSNFGSRTGSLGSSWGRDQSAGSMTSSTTKYDRDLRVGTHSFSAGGSRVSSQEIPRGMPGSRDMSDYSMAASGGGDRRESIGGRGMADKGMSYGTSVMTRTIGGGRDVDARDTMGAGGSGAGLDLRDLSRSGRELNQGVSRQQPETDSYSRSFSRTKYQETPEYSRGYNEEYSSSYMEEDMMDQLYGQQSQTDKNGGRNIRGILKNTSSMGREYESERYGQQRTPLLGDGPGRSSASSYMASGMTSGVSSLGNSSMRPPTSAYAGTPVRSTGLLGNSPQQGYGADDRYMMATKRKSTDVYYMEEKRRRENMW